MNPAFREHLINVLEWADNELNHSQDETSCCYRNCAACKKTRTHPLFKKWWNDGHNPIQDAIESLKREDVQHYDI